MSGWSPRGVIDSFLELFDVSVYGARGDGIALADGVMTSGSGVLTSASRNFAGSDKGKTVRVQGAGASTTFTGNVSTTSIGVPIGSWITNCSATAGIVPGQLITGTGIPANTYVVGIVLAGAAGVIAISKVATATNAGVTLTVSGSISGTIDSVSAAGAATLSVAASTSVAAGGVVFGSDDSVPIAAAVAALVSAGLGALFFPEGAYFDGGGHTLPDGSQILGIGRGSFGLGSCVMQKPGTVSADLFTLGKLCTVSDLGLSGEFLSCSGTGRLLVIPSAYATLSRLWLDTACGDGIGFTTAASVGAQLTDLIMRQVQGVGINFALSAFDTELTKVNIGNCGLDGVKTAAADTVLTQVHSWGNGTRGTSNQQNGVTLSGAVNGTRLESCDLETNYGRGLYGPNANAEGTEITGGAIWGNGIQGVYCFTHTLMGIANVAVYNNGQRGSAGHNSAGIENDTGGYWALTGNRSFDDQATKTQTFAYFESNGADHNSITGNNWAASKHKTGSTTITGTNNVPVSAAMGTLNIVV